jgi:hypothetical protein
VEILGYHRVKQVNLIRITPAKVIDGKEAYCKPIDFQIDNCVEGTGNQGRGKEQ